MSTFKWYIECYSAFDSAMCHERFEKDIEQLEGGQRAPNFAQAEQLRQDARGAGWRTNKPSMCPKHKLRWESQ